MNDGAQQAGTTAGMAGPSVLVEGYSAAETATIRRFLLESSVLKSNYGVTTIAKMRPFLRRRMR